VLLWLERLYPLIGALATGVVFVLFLRSRSFPSTLPDLFAAVISVGAIAIGFLATAKTILISLNDRPVIQKLRTTGYYRWVVGYILEAINWSFAMTLMSAAGLLMTFAPAGQEQDLWHGLFLAVWATSLAGAALSYFRVVRVLSKVLRQAST
jgi:hypothetical protein